jgi:hypothetical protein
VIPTKTVAQAKSKSKKSILNNLREYIKHYLKVYPFRPPLPPMNDIFKQKLSEKIKVKPIEVCRLLQQNPH